MSFFQPAPVPETPLGRLRVLSTSAGIRVSPLQLGGMSIGDEWSGGFGGGLDKKNAFDLLDAYVGFGGNIIDTANHYQNGQSEELIGQWMTERNNRDRLVIATKYTTEFRHDIPKGVAGHYHGNHKKSMFLSVEASLKKLQTSYIDILYIHWWDWASSIKEVVDALHILVQQGKVLYLGVSDTPAWIVAAANEYALSNGKTPFTIYQGLWNVMVRDFERDILPMARHYGIALAPWSVTGSGKFQSKAAWDARKRNNEGVRGFGGVEMTEKEVKISAALEKVAKELGDDYTITAVAIAYVMAKAPRVFPIIGGRKIAQWKENIKALDIRLSPDQIKELENVIAFDVGFPNNFTGQDPKVMGKENAGALLNASAFVDWQPAEKPVGY